MNTYRYFMYFSLLMEKHPTITIRGGPTEAAYIRHKIENM